MKGFKFLAIISKLTKSFEATKQSLGAWIAFGVCLAVAGACALVGIMMWSADFIGSIPTCFLFSGLFVLAAGVVKHMIDAKEKEASHKLTSAKEEVKQDVAAITMPLNLVIDAKEKEDATKNYPGQRSSATQACRPNRAGGLLNNACLPFEVAQASGEVF